MTDTMKLGTELLDSHFYDGNIDLFSDCIISGWIKNKDSTESVMIDLFIDGEMIARSIEAKDYRDDLDLAGIGTGHHAFRISTNALGKQSDPSRFYTIELRAPSDGAVLLQKSMPCVSAEPHAVSFSGFIGNIDGFGDGTISGWVKHHASDTGLAVDVFVDGELVARSIDATIYRDDLKIAGLGTGHHAFSVPFSLSLRDNAAASRLYTVELRSALDGAVLLQRRLRARSSEVSNGPIPNFLGRILKLDETIIRGWAKLQGNESQLTIDVFLNGKKIISALKADEVVEASDENGNLIGSYGFSVPLTVDFESRPFALEVEVRLSEDGVLILSESSLFSGHTHSEASLSAREELIDREADAKVPTAPAPADYVLRLESVKDNQLRGWAVDKLNPSRTFDVDVLIDGYPLRTARNDRPRSDLGRLGLSSGLGGLSVEIPFNLFGPGEIEVGFRTPDGKLVSSRISVDDAAASRHLNFSEILNHEVAVIVPVYNAAEDLKICIERLATYTSSDVDVLFIDDCSPDPEIQKVLKSAAKRHKNMRVLSNAANLGFSGTINRGIVETGAADVILLNSDARVTHRWVEGLRAAVYSDHRIGTATAMSDRAGAFSAPRSGNENVLPAGVDEATFARVFRRSSRGFYPRVPTGNGFCMYVRRDCVEEVGVFDQAAFPKGYGEENDFCMRARRAGWRHVIDDRTYVFHDRSKSFGESKSEHIAAGRAIVDARYPEYRHAIAVFHNSAEISAARMTAHKAVQSILLGKSAETRVLFVVSTQTGGTPQTNADLMRAFDGDIEGWSLRCDSNVLELCRLQDDVSIVVAHHTLAEKVDALTHQSLEYERVVQNWILMFDFDIIHIRHLAWHSINLPKLAKKMGVRVVFSFHDFYMLTPTIKMIDDAGQFLGNHYVPEGREKREGLWARDSQPDPTGGWLAYWRQRNAEALTHCDAFITTSNSARSLILDHLPSLPSERFLVIPHGRDFPKMSRLCEPYLKHDEPIRILTPGNINKAKGLQVILDLLAHDKAGLLEFHVLGDINLPKKEGHPRLFLHGKYKRDDFGRHVADLHVNAGAVFSIWDETYCHTLTEMWSVGLPVMVIDMPNVADRVRRTGAGWVMKHDDISQLYDDILRKISDPKEHSDKIAAVANWQCGYGVAYGTRMMASNYLAVYRDVLRDSTRIPGTGTLARVAVVCPAERSQRRANASTIIRIWERCRNSIDRDISFIRMTPESLVASLKDKLVDAAIIQRNAIPRTLVGPMLAASKAMNIPYLMDIDDDLLNVPACKDPHGIYAEYAPALRQLLEEAAVVTVSTDKLRTALKPFGKRIELLPNKLSGRLWTALPKTERQPDRYVRACYMNSRTHDEDLHMILPALDEIAAQHEHFRCVLIGVTAEAAALAGRERWLEMWEVPSQAKTYDAFVPWLLRQAPQFDFGLAPLVDSAFNACKSSLKLLDYAGIGLPVVVSDTAAYRDLARVTPHAALVANTQSDWTNALSAFVNRGHRPNEVDSEIKEWLRASKMWRPALRDIDALVKQIVQ